MNESEYKRYALYNRDTGLVNRFITCTREMFLQVTWMDIETDAMEVDMFLPAGNYQLVGSELVPYTPEV